jgi:hypothetical protein
MEKTQKKKMSKASFEALYKTGKGFFTFCLTRERVKKLADKAVAVGVSPSELLDTTLAGMQ